MTFRAINNKKAEIIYTRDMMDYEINVYGSEEQPLFLMRDVNDWLEGKADPSQLARLAEDEDKVMYKVEDLQGKVQQHIFVNEDGLYEICMRSKLPKAKKVRKFIKSILKELRTQGFVATGNNSEIANAMTMIAHSLQPMQQALVSIQKENEDFRDVVMEKQYDLESRAANVENSLKLLRIDNYELSNLTLLVRGKREKNYKYFDKLSKEYNVASTRIAKIWDNLLYSGMYKVIGREKIQPFENKSIHCGQSIKDITKAEYPIAIAYIETFNFDKEDFEIRVYEKYNHYIKDDKKQLELNFIK